MWHLPPHRGAQTLQCIRLDDNQVTPRGLADLALGLQANASLVELPLPMLDVSHCTKTDATATERAVHAIQTRLHINNSPVPRINAAFDEHALMLATATAQRALENALVQLEATTPPSSENITATTELKRAAARAVRMCSAVADSQTEHKNAFLTSLEQQLFAISQDLSQLVTDRLRANTDVLLDQLVDDAARADSANAIRPQLAEHEAAVREYIGRTITTAAASYISALVSERMNQLAIEVITALTSQSLDRLQAVLRERQNAPKTMAEIGKIKSIENNIAPVQLRQPSVPALSKSASEADALSESTWRHSRLPFTADHSEDEIRSEAPIDITVRATDQRSKSTKQLVHLTKDRPKMQVCERIVKDNVLNVIAEPSPAEPRQSRCT